LLAVAASALLYTWCCGVASAAVTGKVEVCKDAANGSVGDMFDFQLFKGANALSPVIVVPGGQCATLASGLSVANVNGPITYKIVETPDPSSTHIWQMVAPPASPATGLGLGSGGAIVSVNAATATVTFNLDQSGADTVINVVNQLAGSSLKICKKTSDPALAGKSYTFTVGGTQTVSAIANGACSGPIAYQQGSKVVVQESVPQFQYVKSATGDAASGPTVLATGTDLTVGKVKVQILAGHVNVLTFDNESTSPSQQGNMEICKVAGDSFINQISSFHYTIQDGNQTFTADVTPGQCSGPINGMYSSTGCTTCGIPAGTVTVTEVIPQNANWQLSSVALHASSAGSLGLVTLANGTALVVVPIAAAGEVVVDYTNTTLLAPVKVCKLLSAGSNALTGKTFNFTVSDDAVLDAYGNPKQYPVSIVASAPGTSGACVFVSAGRNKGDLQVPVGSNITVTESNSNQFIDAGGGPGNSFTVGPRPVHSGVNEVDFTNTALGQLEICKYIVKGDPDYGQTFTFTYSNADKSVTGTAVTSSGSCSFPAVVPVGTYTVTEDLSQMTVTLANGQKVPIYLFAGSDARNNMGQSLCQPPAAYPAPTPPASPPGTGCGNPMTVTVPYAADPAQGEANVAFWNKFVHASAKICKIIDPHSFATLNGLPFTFTASYTVDTGSGPVTTTYGPFQINAPYTDCPPFGDFILANKDGSPTTVTVTEVGGTAYETSSITVSPGAPVSGSPDLLNGSITFNPGAGLNGVIFTNIVRCSGANGAIPAGTPGTQAFYDNSQPAIAFGCAVYVVQYPGANNDTDLALEFVRGPNTGTNIVIGHDLVGANGANGQLSDIAMTSSGAMYGVNNAGTFFDVDPVTGHLTVVATVGTSQLAGNPVALVVGPTGIVYANQSLAPGYFDSINPTTGVATLIGTPSAVSSGDLAFVGSGTNLVMTVIGDDLYQVNPTNGSSTLIGPTGDVYVFGLAGSYGELFGFDVFGNLLRIDPATGAATVIAFSGPAFSGAASPPNHT
jgi:hypothetical protein